MDDWLKLYGASGLDDLELADFPDTGRGIRTLKTFGKGETILTIPHAVLWTIKHAHADPLLGPALLSARPPLTVDDTLAVYILFIRSRDSGYTGLREHVAAIPRSYTSTIFFSDAELEVCAGSPLFTTTKQLHDQINVDHAELVERLFKQNEELFPLNKFTIEDYKWALCTVWSRAMDFKLSDGDPIRLIAPFADMFNHSPEVEQCHIYDVSSGNVSVLAGRDYNSGDQVFINYGPVPNNRLLRLYGFVVPENPYDGYDLVLATHPTAPLFEQKLKIWRSAGLDLTITVPLTLTDSLPNSILQYLRIQRLEGSDLAVVAPFASDTALERISDTNEEQVLQFLKASISTLLDGFEVQLEKLEGQVANEFYAVQGNAWSAAHVSMGEQRVLRKTRKTVEDMLAAAERRSGDGNDQSSISTQCANCKKVSGDLKWCGRCNKVRYCGRPCQVAHYKEHKAICRAMAAKNGNPASASSLPRS